MKKVSSFFFFPIMNIRNIINVLVVQICDPRSLGFGLVELELEDFRVCLIYWRGCEDARGRRVSWWFHSWLVAELGLEPLLSGGSFP